MPDEQPPPQKRRTGRPTKLTPELQARLCEAIRGGTPFNHACAYAGISYANFRLWMLKGEVAQSGMFRELFDAVKKAESDAVMRNVLHVQKAAPDTWQAAAWWLERRYPQEFALRARIDVNVEVRKEAERLAAEMDLPVEEVIREAEAMLAAKRSR